MVLPASPGYTAGALPVKRSFADVPPLGVLTAATAITTLLLAPRAAVNPPARVPTAAAGGRLLALGVPCTAMALRMAFW